MFGSWLKPPMSDFDKELLSSNITRAKDMEQLHLRENILTTLRTYAVKKVPIKGNFDYQHFKEIHKYLFQDVYVWAGMDRYDIGIRGMFRKGDSYFTPGDKLPQVAASLFGALEEENFFQGLEKEPFIKSIASFFNGLNILHPFREGNGRTQRIFVEHLANNAGYHLDLSKVSKSVMIQASIQGSKGNVKGFEIIMKNAIKET